VRCRKRQRENAENTEMLDGDAAGLTDKERLEQEKWQWHQLGHMQVCTSLQTDNHTSTHRSVFYRPDALPAAQPTVSKH